MSFLAGRLAGKEGAFFFQESKHAVGRIAASQKKSPSPPPEKALSPAAADVLPEVMRHSLPSKLFRHETEAPSSISNFSASRWALPSSSETSNDAVSRNLDAINPLRAYVTLPQATFGPKRWLVPQANGSVTASTANELRQQRDPPAMTPEKMKAVAQGFTQIGMAFAVATALVFGGAAFVVGMASSKLELQNFGDIRTKVKEIVEPKRDRVEKQLGPLKDWACNVSKKWHFEKDEGISENRVAKELSKMWGAKTSG